MAALPGNINTEGHIVVRHHDVSILFLTGKVVFKIVKCSHNDTIDSGVDVPKYTDYWMCTTFHEYQARLESHEYIPILWVAPLTYKLAYLYGCLNRKRNIPRLDNFIFLYREIGKSNWKEWFVVNSYRD